MIEGTDLSYSNGKVNYPAMLAAGIRFAFIKIGQGLSISDPLYVQHKAGCKAAGVRWSPYFFCDYRYSALAQAIRFSLLPGDEWGNQPAVMDLEYEERLGWGRPSGSAMYQWGCAFINQFELSTANKRALDIYTNPDLIHEMKPYLKPGDPFMRHGLFLAHWTSDVKFADFEPWGSMQYWQQAGDVKGAWSEGAVDYDYFIGSETDFSALAPDPFPNKIYVPIAMNNCTPEQRISGLEAWAAGQGYKGPQA
jgi:GH25 family lysozyme M1 (1,4-beta-N-acetylmuramidase)